VVVRGNGRHCDNTSAREGEKEHDTGESEAHFADDGGWFCEGDVLVSSIDGASANMDLIYSIIYVL
jgi:hypothetical protein